MTINAFGRTCNSIHVVSPHMNPSLPCHLIQGDGGSLHAEGPLNITTSQFRYHLRMLIRKPQCASLHDSWATHSIPIVLLFRRDNSCARFGGAIASTKHLYITQSSFDDNMVIVVGEGMNVSEVSSGGAIMSQYSASNDGVPPTLYLENVSFSRNAAPVCRVGACWRMR